MSGDSKGTQLAAGDLGIPLIKHWWKPLSGISKRPGPSNFWCFIKTATVAGYGEWNLLKWRYIFKNKVSEKAYRHSSNSIRLVILYIYFLTFRSFLANLLSATVYQGLFICFSLLFYSTGDLNKVWVWDTTTHAAVFISVLILYRIQQVALVVLEITLQPQQAWVHTFICMSR